MTSGNDGLRSLRSLASLPAPGKIWVAATVAGAGGYTAARAGSPAPLAWAHTPALTAVLTAVLAAGVAGSLLLAARTGVSRGHRQVTITIDTVFLVAGALLLPAGLVALLCGAGALAGWWLYRSVPVRIAYTIAKNQLALAAVAGTAAALLPGRAITHEPAGLLVGVVAAVSAAYTAADVVQVTVLTRLVHQVEIRRNTLLHSEYLWLVVREAALGAVAAGLWAVDPLLGLLTLPLLVTAQRDLGGMAVAEASQTDTKTGLANAGFFQHAAVRELHRADRRHTDMSVLLLDMDNLRAFNNTFGHLAGDAAIRAVADTLRSCLRDYDLPARFGGEEFAVLLPETGLEPAQRTAERIRTRLAATDVTGPGLLAPQQVTVSIGVGTRLPGENLEMLLLRTDTALYTAKQAGRNRVCAATGPSQRTGQAVVVPLQRGPADSPADSPTDTQACIWRGVPRRATTRP